MDCRKLNVRLHAYLDGELPPADQEAFDRHLARCAACRAEVERQESLGRMLQSVQRPEAPAGLAERILIEAAKRSDRKAQAGRRFGSIAVWLDLEEGAMRAAAAIAVVVGLTAGSLLGWSSFDKGPARGSETSQADAEILLAFDAFSASSVEPLEAMYVTDNALRP